MTEFKEGICSYWRDYNQSQMAIPIIIAAPAAQEHVSCIVLTICEFSCARCRECADFEIHPSWLENRG